MPLAALAAPRSLADPIVAVHAIPLGLTGAPPAVTRTVAETADPAFGFPGESLTALATRAAGGGGRGGGGGDATTANLKVSLLFERSGSGSAASTVAVIS